MPTLTNYHWDPVNDCVLLETDQSGNTVATYTHEPGPFGPLLSENRGAIEFYHHYDALGSTTLLTNDTGSVTDTFAYDAWGSVVGRIGTTATPYQWVGRWGYHCDTPTNSYYVRARSCTPMVARWSTADPTSFYDGLNLYTLVRNSPILYIDPSGLKCLLCLVSAYYKAKISTLDSLVENNSFSNAANTAAEFGNPVAPWGNAMFGIPNAYPGAGAFFYSNSDPFTDPTGFTVKTSGAKVGVYLFFVTFDVRETNPGDCRLFLDETGTTLTTFYPDKPPEVDKGHSTNHRDITGMKDTRTDKLRHPVPNAACCDTMLIYFDAPGALAIMQQQRKMWFTQVVKQKIELRDGSNNNALITTFSHEVVIGVGPRREEIASP